MPFGLPDAAMVSQMAKQENVPQEQLMQWAANKGIPVALVQMMLKYDALQAAAQRQGQGVQPPKTTVAQDLDQGLAALRQQRQPQQMMPQFQQMMPQSQPQQMMQPSANPGIAGLNTGTMENAQYAGGGIVAFANTGAVEGSEPRKFNNELPFSMAPGEPAATQQQFVPSGVGATTLDQSGDRLSRPFGPYTLPPDNGVASPVQRPLEASNVPAANGTGAGPSDYGMSELSKAYKKLDVNFNKQLDDLNKYELYQASTDPSIDQKRYLITAQKVANALKLPKDKWQILIADGQAMMEEASKPRQPGEANAWTYWGAGAKAAYAKAKELNDTYAATQKQLDETLIDLNHQDWVASETNNKDAIMFRNTLRDKAAQLMKDKDALRFDYLKTIGTLSAQRDIASATREATAQSRKDALEAKLAGIDAETRKNIVAAAQNKAKTLIGSIRKDGTPITAEDVDAVMPQILDQAIQMYSIAGRASAPSIGATSIVPSGGTGTGNTISLNQMPK